MILKLLPPKSSLNWMLVAERIEDPSNWSQFLLNHGPGSERHNFEQAATQASNETGTKTSAYRLLCKRGQCGLEYEWTTSPNSVRCHALRVAELLGMEIDLPQSAYENSQVS